jgi:hypothetical protein
MLSLRYNLVGTACRDTHKQMMWMWGANSCGELGLGHKRDTLVPTPMRHPTTDRIAQASRAHTPA